MSRLISFYQSNRLYSIASRRQSLSEYFIFKLEKSFRGSFHSNSFRYYSATARNQLILQSTNDKKGFALGITRETYNKWERRTPLCPSHVQDLLQMKDGPSEIILQPAGHRIFTDAEYRNVGAVISDDLSKVDLILGVKQVKVHDLISEKPYMFFSHVIKGQPENMPMLQAIIDKNIQLFDYECIVEESVEHTKLQTDNKRKRRLVSFGKYAGIAGMIDILQALGMRLLASGYSTPFLSSRPAYMYHDLEDAKNGIMQIGKEILRVGLPEDLEPLVFAFTGKGNVARGALEIFKLLPHEMITLDQLKNIKRMNGPQNLVYGIALSQQDLVRHRSNVCIESDNFDVYHYRKNPHEYEPVFHKFVAPYCNVLVNGIYWDERYPRILTKRQLQELYLSNNKNLLAVADISCDVNGSVEFLDHSTTIDKQFFQFDPITGDISDDITEKGVVVMGCDILPTELARESSKNFGDTLVPLIKDFIIENRKGKLPEVLKNACITSGGSFMPSFRYIEALKSRAISNKNKISGPSLSFHMEGHLFDSGLINQTLDVIESFGCYFEIVECTVKPNAEQASTKSTVLIRVKAEKKDKLIVVASKIKILVDLITNADATLRCYEGSSTSHEKLSVVVHSEQERKILILGAGRVAASASEYLGRSDYNFITVASEIQSDSDAVASYAKRGKGVMIDVVKDKSKLSLIINDADVVISLLPATMHAEIANICIAMNTNLVTASYTSDEIRALHEKCKDASLTILTECGLDPGMDHMSVMKIIDDIKARDGKIIGFSSVCGGLPSPEAANNPLMYKFSWSPLGVIRASCNDASYLSEGKRINVDGDSLLSAAKPFSAWPTLNLECLPNRNSLIYREQYGIQDATCLYRGTLRYQGFSAILDSLKKLGLFEDIEASSIIWSDVISHLCSNRGHTSLKAFLKSHSEGFPVTSTKSEDFFDWLGLNSELKLTNNQSILTSLCHLLQEKLAFQECERDMVLMHHKVDAIFDNEKKRETHHSSMQLFGDEKMSAMCKTVGYTAAIGANLMLNEKIRVKGVLLPTRKEVYVPCLEALEEEGIKFDENVIITDI